MQQTWFTVLSMGYVAIVNEILVCEYVTELGMLIPFS